jgi:hypothetical protein
LTVLKKKETSKLTEAFFEERPTKLEIPDSTLGGDVDGMGDLDNAPMPPMGADDMGGEGQMTDPMGGAPDDMGGEDPNAMGEEPPMGDEEPMGGEDDELMDIINGLSIEDKAAVTKYAKSMADDSNGKETPDMGGEMPMESRRDIRNLIDEVINDVLDNREGTKRPEKKLPKQYRNVEMPFKSPF